MGGRFGMKAWLGGQVKGSRKLSLGWWVQIPVKDEVSNEDAAQYLINPVTGACLGQPYHTSAVVAHPVLLASGQFSGSELALPMPARTAVRSESHSMAVSHLGGNDATSEV